MPFGRTTQLSRVCVYLHDRAIVTDLSLVSGTKQYVLGQKLWRENGGKNCTEIPLPPKNNKIKTSDDFHWNVIEVRQI